MNIAWKTCKAEVALEDKRGGTRTCGNRQGGVSYTCRCDMSCPTVISSAIFWYKLWLFKTMLSRMARDL